MLDPHIPPPLQDIIQRELVRGEHVRWTAMPKPRLFTGPAMAPFLWGIPWTAFALFWTAGAFGFDVPDFDHGFDLFPLLGIPFVLVGIVLLSSPFWSYRRQLQTVYLITDHRAITIEGGRSATVRSYRPENLQDVFRREHRDATGDVVITRTAWRDSDGDKQMEELGFLRIENAKTVEAMLNALAVGARNESSRASNPRYTPG